MYYGPPILGAQSTHGYSSHTDAYRAICQRFFQAQTLDDDTGKGVVLVTTKNEVDSICAAVSLLKLLDGHGVDAFLYPVVDEVWHRMFLTGMSNYTSEENWQRTLAETGVQPRKTRVRRLRLYLHPYAHVSAPSCLPQVSSVVHIDPRDDITVETELRYIPEDIPIHIISSRTMNDACFYSSNIARINVWHDKYPDSDIDKAIDLDPHTVDLSTVRFPLDQELCIRLSQL